MLTAHCKGSNHIFAPEVDKPGEVRKLGRNGRLVCPLCEAPVHFKGRRGGEKIWHFAHYEREECILDDPDYGPETREHRLLKWAVRRWLADRYRPEQIQVESKVETGQAADVLLDLDGRRVALEIQRSSLSPEGWAERRQKYRSAGVFDEWILVGGNHVDPVEEVGQSGFFDFSPLARAIIEKTGRLLWIDDETVAQIKDTEKVLSPPGAEEVQIWALEILAAQYGGRSGSPGRRDAILRGRPFPERPEQLVNTGLLKEKVEHKSVHVGQSAVGRHPLSRFQVAENSSALALESPVASAGDVERAWSWEEANRTYREEYKAEKKRREELRRDAPTWERHDYHASEKDLLVGVGSAVREDLADLLAAISELRSSAENDSADLNRNARPQDTDVLPEGVWKWPPRCWTPLADLNVPLDWIFGVAPRLWQMRVYCTQFYHTYAEKYRSKQEIGTTQYSRLRTGYALKALSDADLFGSSAEREIKSCLRSINRKVDEAVVRPPARPKWMDYHLVKLHSVRHLVMMAYFERLREVGFLSRNDLAGKDDLDPCGARRVRKALIDACDLVRRMRRGRPLPGGFLERLGRRWVNVAWSCRNASERAYELTSPFHPPYYQEGTQSRMDRAIGAGMLRVDEDSICAGHGEVIAELDWKD